MTIKVKTKNTVCKHVNSECCFHGVCTVLKVLSPGTLLIENRDGFVRLIEPDLVNEVDTVD